MLAHILTTKNKFGILLEGRKHFYKKFTHSEIAFYNATKIKVVDRIVVHDKNGQVKFIYTIKNEI